MCGRFAQDFSRDEAFKLAHELNLTLEWDPLQDLLSDTNIAPHDQVLVLSAKTNTLRVTSAIFGITLTSRTVINARSETLTDKPMFARLVPAGCCLIPASGFFEWHSTPHGKIPHFFRSTKGRPVYLVALFDKRSGGAVVLTRAARQPVAAIHQREPVLATIDEFIPWCENGTLDFSEVSLTGTRLDHKLNNPRYKTSP